MKVDSVSSIMQQSCSDVQNRVQTNERYSIQLPKIAQNMSKVAFPIIALLALSNLNGVEAGFISYGVCVVKCNLFMPPAALQTCVERCLSLLITCGLS